MIHILCVYKCVYNARHVLGEIGVHLHYVSINYSTGKYSGLNFFVIFCGTC